MTMPSLGGFRTAVFHGFIVGIVTTQYQAFKNLRGLLYLSY